MMLEVSDLLLSRLLLRLVVTAAGGDMEQTRMHAEMNKPAEPQPVNPRDVA